MSYIRFTRNLLVVWACASGIACAVEAEIGDTPLDVPLPGRRYYAKKYVPVKIDVCTPTSVQTKCLSVDDETPEPVYVKCATLEYHFLPGCSSLITSSVVLTESCVDTRPEGSVHCNSGS